MQQGELILRRWNSRIRTGDEESYVAYVSKTGLDDYAKTPGNRGCQILLRRLNDGVSEVTTLSWWTSFEAIRLFAGDDYEIARYYPEDDRYLLEKPRLVEHHVVAAGDTPEVDAFAA